MYVSAIWGTYMKKVIATIMAAAVMLSQLSLLVKATDGNPLAVSNRVTADINELRPVSYTHLTLPTSDLV